MTMVSTRRRQTMAPELKTERELSLDFLRVTEAAAIAAARTMGQGDREYSDQVAVEAMREVMDSRSEEHTSELQSLAYLVCRLLLEKKKTNTRSTTSLLRT